MLVPDGGDFPQVPTVTDDIFTLCYGDDAAGFARKQRAADAGVIEAVAAALQAHPEVEAVQDMGCWALTHVCSGRGAAARGRRRRAVTARAPEAATAALQAHPYNAEVQEQGQQLRDLLV